VREFEIILGLVFVATLLQPIARCFDVPLAIAQVFVALVLVTIAAVAAVAHTLAPRIRWVAAFVLGASMPSEMQNSRSVKRHATQLRAFVTRKRLAMRCSER